MTAVSLNLAEVLYIDAAEVLYTFGDGAMTAVLATGGHDAELSPLGCGEGPRSSERPGT